MYDIHTNIWIVLGALLIHLSYYIIIVFVTGGSCNCVQTYTGEDDLLLSTCSNSGYNFSWSRPFHLFTYSLLIDYSISWGKSAQSISGYYRQLNSKYSTKYRVPVEKLLPRHLWFKAVWLFWEQVLEMDTKNLLCEDCGPRPEVLVADGVAIGMQHRGPPLYCRKTNYGTWR